MSGLNQVDWAGHPTAHGGKRTGAGRKPSGKQTAVVRVDAELLPVIEQLKQGLINVTGNQAEIDRLLQVNEKLVFERDGALIERDKAKAESAHFRAIASELNALKHKPEQPKQIICQCLTAKGEVCGKTASHESKFNGFVVWTCERHYKAVINKT
jgi:hypothetical protein